MKLKKKRWKILIVKGWKLSQKNVKALNQVHEDLYCKQRMLQTMSYSQKLQNKNGVMKYENLG